jgi:[protein-PII] uridylyltransferase
LDITDAEFGSLARRLPESYWIAEADDILAHNARHILAAGKAPLSIAAQVYPERGATLVTIYAADHPGLFYRIAGAIHLAGGKHHRRAHPYHAGRHGDRQFPGAGSPRAAVRRAQPAQPHRARYRGRARQQAETPAQAGGAAAPRARAEAFAIAPNVLIDNKASNRFTVIEIHARDKPALLFNLAYALFQSKVTVHSAHISTYGERAVDTFYITDLLGGKIESKSRLQTLERRLLEASEATVMEQMAA